MAKRTIDVTFRQNPVHGIKGSLGTMFKSNYINYNVNAILEHLVAKIDDTRYGKLKRNQFTLVNVYNPDTRHSVGYLEAPPPDVITPLSGLVFTFALTSKPVRKTPKQIETNRIIDKTMFWGKSVTDITDYLTVNIPKDFLTRERSQFPYVDDLLYLYNVAGLYTKNYVLNGLDIYDNSPVDVLHSRYLDANLKYLFNNCSRQYWRYCEQFWQSCPNLTITEDFDDTFYLYFSLYLFDKVGPDCGNLAKNMLFTKGPGTLHWFILDGLRAYVHSVRSSGAVIIEPSLVAAVSLMLYLIEGEGLSSGNSKNDIDQFVDKSRLRIKNDPQEFFFFSNTFSDLSRVASDLVDLNGEADFLKFWS